MTTPRMFVVPTYLRGRIPLLEASINTFLECLDELDVSELSSIIDFDTLNYDELEKIFAFFRITPLFSRIFIEERIRELARHGDELFHFKGREYALDLFSTLIGVTYSWVFRKDSSNRIVGIHFTISPPTGLHIGQDWQQYMINAFKFLLPVRLTLDTFTISLSAVGNTYVYATTFLTEEIV